jgi:hypothetical protein
MIWDSNFHDIAATHVILPIKRHWKLHRAPTFSTSAHDQNNLNLSFRARSFFLPISAFTLHPLLFQILSRQLHLVPPMAYWDIPWSTVGLWSEHISFSGRETFWELIRSKFESPCAQTISWWIESDNLVKMGGRDWAGYSNRLWDQLVPEAPDDLQ